MAFKQNLINALGDEYSLADEITVERLCFYYEIFKKAYNDVKNEGYRKLVANEDPHITPPANARYFLNLSFTIMNDCAKHIRSDIEMLGLSKKGKKIEITNKLEKSMSLLDQMNEIPDG